MASYKKLRRRNIKLQLKIENLKLKRDVKALLEGKNIPKEHEIKGFRHNIHYAH